MEPFTGCMVQGRKDGRLELRFAEDAGDARRVKDEMERDGFRGVVAWRLSSGVQV